MNSNMRHSEGGAATDSEGGMLPSGAVEDSYLFAMLEPENDVLPSQKILDILKKKGFVEFDKRLKKEYEVLKRKQFLDIQEFSELTNNTLVDAAIRGDLVVSDFEGLTSELTTIFDKLKTMKGGKVADYIPQLGKVDPSLWAVAVVTVEGQVFEIGDSRVPFCIQSTSKPITYCMALEEHGDVDFVHQHVGMEPSGRNFNELALDYKRRPHNPLINAGAIMTSSLVKGAEPQSNRFDFAMKTWRRLSAHQSPVTFGNSTFLSELATADRNFCLAYLMREAKKFPKNTEIQKALEYYFMLCSIETDSLGLATVAASLANGGVCPLTVDKVFETDTVQNCLSLMLTCGMYDFSGEWAFRIGVPAKSGVSGALMVVIPGQMGICVYSPPLDALGNSVRGCAFLAELSKVFPVHMYEKINPKGELDDEGNAVGEQDDGHLERYNYDLNSLLYSAASGDIAMIKRILARGCPINGCDYDGRTALHLAVCEKRVEAVHYLVHRGADPNFSDRLGNSPLDDAMRTKKQLDCPEINVIISRLEQAVAQSNSTMRRNDSLTSLQSAQADPIVNVCQSLVEDDGRISVEYIEKELELAGVHLDTAIGKRAREAFWPPRSSRLSVDEAIEVLSHDKRGIIQRVLQGSTTVPDFQNMRREVEELYQEILKKFKGGVVTDYVPQLSAENINKDAFVVSMCTLDGQRADFGDDYDKPVSLQAVSSVLAYAEVLSQKGQGVVHEMVGREPSGRGGAELVLNSAKKPHNPLINAGHLAVSSIFRPEEGLDSRFDAISDAWKAAAGGERCGFDNGLFLSEMDVADRNFCLSYLLRENEVFPEGTDLVTNIKFYLQQHALEMSPRSLAVVASTLANGGVCPLTGKRVYTTDVVRNVLSMMFTCGMADTSGEIAFTAGIPMKDSWSGVCMVVIPGVMGCCIYSPKLDENHTSVRGVQFLKRISDMFKAHVFGRLPGSVEGSNEDKCGVEIRGDDALRDEFCQLIYAAQHGDVKRVQKGLTLGVDIDTVDYDKRSMLHIAASDGCVSIVAFLLRNGADVNLVDRWGETPLQSALANDHQQVANMLKRVTEAGPDAKGKRLWAVAADLVRSGSFSPSNSPSVETIPTLDVNGNAKPSPLNGNHSPRMNGNGYMNGHQQMNGNGHHVTLNTPDSQYSAPRPNTTPMKTPGRRNQYTPGSQRSTPMSTPGANREASR